MRFLPLIRHFYNIIRRYIEPQKLEVPDSELYHQYGHLMGRFAHLYLNSGYTAKGEYVFWQAIDYQKIFREQSWLKDRRSLLLLKGLAMMFSKNGKMTAAEETIRTLYDASMSLFGPGDEITSWATSRLPAVMDRKTQNVENELRAVIASQGEKQKFITPRRIPNDSLQSMSQELLNRRLDLRYEFDHGVDVSAFHKASTSGDEESIRLELDNGVDVNPLQAACYQGHIAIVDILLRNGADVNAGSLGHGTALQIAAHKGHYSITQLLLASGADVNAKGGFYPTALYLAVFNGHHKIAQRLLDHGADVKATGCTYESNIQIARRYGDQSMVSLLLANGADEIPPTSPLQSTSVRLRR